MDAKAAGPDDADNLANSDFAAIVRLKRAAGPKATIRNREHNGLKQGPILI